METCFECGKAAEHNHHVIPKSKGGTKTVPLCTECHGKVHGRNMVHMAELSRLGIQVAKRKGIYNGRKKGTTKGEPSRAKELRAKGLTTAEIAQTMGTTKRTVQRYLKSDPANGKVVAKFKI
jgi:hypothetical protein